MIVIQEETRLGRATAVWAVDGPDILGETADMPHLASRRGRPAILYRSSGESRWFHCASRRCQREWPDDNTQSLAETNRGHSGQFGAPPHRGSPLQAPMDRSPRTMAITIAVMTSVVTPANGGCWIGWRAYFDLDGRMNDRKEVTARGELREPRLTSVAKVADLARQDKDFMQVAEIFTGRMDFDVGALVGELVAAESVPALPVLRYKPAAMDKRAAWERTWDLQRLEDAVDSLFEVERLTKIEAGKAEETAQPARGRAADRRSGQAAGAARGGQRGGLRGRGGQAETESDQRHHPPARPRRRQASQEGGRRRHPVPPKYTSADFLSSNFWRLRGKLDVPKERWVSFPHCEGEDGTLVIAWAGYDHLQLARAIAERYELAKEQEGRKLVPLLAAIGQLIPWLKQWHNELDPAYGTRMGDYFEGYLAEEAKTLGMSVEQVMAWTPPEKVKGRGRKRS